MSTSSQSFEQVRSILSKLDRDIEAARARRLNSGPPVRPFAAPAAVRPAPARPPERDPLAMSPEPGRSGYGVARPMRRGDM
jgi:hypothetical protein